MNIAICDDEKGFRILLENNLKMYFDERSIPLNIIHFSCGEELLESSLLFDLIFMDVEMKEINGIDTGRKLKERNPHCIIIVITSHDGYLDKAFKINAFRFLPKPLDMSRLFTALDDAFELLNNDIIVFHDILSMKDIRIYTNDIIYIEIIKKKTKIVTVNGTYYSREKISWWKSKLNGVSFVYPHASYIANMNYSIGHIRTQLFLAKKDLDGKIIEKYEISIAPKRQAEIKDKFFYVLDRR